MEPRLRGVKMQAGSQGSEQMDQQKFPQPLSGNIMPRAGGIASMMRLPVHADAAGLDACFVGVPFDLGTSNR
ncbi:MAG: hypothetical protein PHU07_13425, partial [Acidocella sp.]|nr:hypothetical protein [Acidocella sp.]